MKLKGIYLLLEKTLYPLSIKGICLVFFRSRSTFSVTLKMRANEVFFMFPPAPKGRVDWK